MTPCSRSIVSSGASMSPATHILGGFGSAGCSDERLLGGASVETGMSSARNKRPKRMAPASRWDVFKNSRADAFDDGLAAGGWNNAIQLESGSAEEVSEFFLGTLFAARQDEHLEIEELGEIRTVARLNYSVHDDDPAVRLVSEGFACVLKNGEGLVIVPVVDDVLHVIGVAAFADRLEEVATDKVATLFATGIADELFSALEKVWHFEQDASHL